MKKFTLSIIALATIFTVGMTSCSGSGEKSGSAADSTAVTDTIAAETVTVDYLLENADSLVGKTVNIEGVCTHICSRGARKIFLMGSDDTRTIRVEAGDLGAFDKKCARSIVNVTGTLMEERIDEAYLKEWEAKAAAAEDQHGDVKKGGCDAEKNARNESGNSVQDRIADFRQKIADRKAKDGREYLSFYYVQALNYSIADGERN
jgi:hypothetical protein